MLPLNYNILSPYATKINCSRWEQALSVFRHSGVGALMKYIVIKKQT